MSFSTLLRVGWHVAQLRRRDRWTGERILAHQARSLERVRQYAYPHSPFYQRFHKGLFDRPLTELPILAKHTMMDNFDLLVTVRSVRLKALEDVLFGAIADQTFLD